ncbi:asparagine synthase (glutamine-hydrolyzing) [Alteromonas sp. S167]|uniref:asparagine synthase (glutamine-hydrolyzing) n=1 Tax=Alteromonas sp. S167 TaxID=3117402 RepID=UPI002FDFF522
MCGVNGIVSFGKPKDFNRNISRLEDMNSSIAHRGPDDSSILVKAGKVFLGHRRLAILDTRDIGNQPMESRSSQFTIAFNGEIYNFKKLKELVSEYPFRTNTDTEVILALCEEFGVLKAINRLEGMFALVIYSQKDNAVFLARDQAGEKPLYYTFDHRELIFSSELKGVLTGAGRKFRLNRLNLGNYWRYGYFIDDQTPLETIKKIKKGNIVKITLEIPHRVELLEYINRENEEEGRIVKPLDQHLKAAIHNSIKAQMVSDVPLGTFLSGGIDSSLVTAVAQKHSSQPLETFTIGFEQRNFDESPFAEKIAAHVGAKSNVIKLSESDLLDNLFPSIDAFGEPFANPSAVPNFILARTARQKVKVCLSGDGGDELFLGYNRYYPAYKIYNKLKSLPVPLSSILVHLISTAKHLDVDSLVGYIEKLSGKKFGANYNDKIQKLNCALLAKNSQDFYLRLISIFDDQYNEDIQGELYNGRAFGFETSYLKASSLWDQMYYLVDDCLFKSDRMSMASSLEVRVPLLAREVMNIANKAPLEYRIGNSLAKAPLRRMLYELVPSELIERPKMGFSVPIASWVNGPLNKIIRETLCDDFVNYVDVISSEVVNKLLLEDDSDHKRELKLWAVFVFHRWVKLNIDHLEL